MKRYVSLEEISDGKLYTANDMVRADCLGCKGCSKCCHAMGDTILLDPCDVWRFQKGLGLGAQELLAQGKIALRVVDGVIVPHMKMQPVSEPGQAVRQPIGGPGRALRQPVGGPGQALRQPVGGQGQALRHPVTDQKAGQETSAGEGEEKCPFLDDEGWCTIHEHRPGLCRLFPLGRYYEGEGFRYFLQKSECDHPKAKVKVSQWLGIPELAKYEAYVLTWHRIQKQAEELQKENGDDGFARNLNMFLLKTFFLLPYDGESAFYPQFERRLEEYRRIVPEA